MHIAAPICACDCAGPDKGVRRVLACMHASDRVALFQGDAREGRAGVGVRGKGSWKTRRGGCRERGSVEGGEMNRPRGTEYCFALNGEEGGWYG